LETSRKNPSSYDPARQGDWFLQTDPIGSGDDLDLYAYTGDDPVNRSDPTGMQASDITEVTVIRRRCPEGWTCLRGDDVERVLGNREQQPRIILINKTNDWNNDERWNEDEADMVGMYLRDSLYAKSGEMSWFDDRENFGFPPSLSSV